MLSVAGRCDGLCFRAKNTSCLANSFTGHTARAGGASRIGLLMCARTSRFPSAIFLMNLGVCQCVWGRRRTGASINQHVPLRQRLRWRVMSSKFGEAFPRAPLVGISVNASPDRQSHIRCRTRLTKVRSETLSSETSACQNLLNAGYLPLHQHTKYNPRNDNPTNPRMSKSSGTGNCVQARDARPRPMPDGPLGEPMRIHTLPPR